MTIKKITPKLKRNCLKLITLSSLLLISSCTQDETILESDLESTNSSKWSTKSVELPVVSINAETEQSTNPASNAIDNDPTSRWSGNGNPVNLDLDLGSVNSLDYLNIAFHKGDERTSSFDVYISTNKVNWTKTDSKTSSGNTEGLQLFDLKNNDTRYIRLVCFGNSNANSNWNSILDIEVMGTPGDDEPTETTGYKSIPAKIQAEDYSDATEGRTETKESNNDGSQVTNVGWIDNGESLFYDINVPSSGQYTIDFRLASQTAGSKFDILKNGSTLGSVSASATGEWYTWDNATETVNLSSGNQTIEIKATGGGWNIDWLEFIAGDVDPITIDPPTGGSVTDILGNYWKITLPVDENGNGSSTSNTTYDGRNIYAYEPRNDNDNDPTTNEFLLNEVADDNSLNDWFWVDGDEVFFKAFCGGATTEGSGYPRSELRGLDKEFSDKESGYFDMDDYQELTVTVRVIEVPAQIPEVNMVQIHGPDDEPLRVEFKDDGERGLHLTLNDNDDSDFYNVIDYEMGQRLRVNVVVDNGRIYVDLRNLDNNDTYTHDFASDDDTGYWKVGCYLQSSYIYCDFKDDTSYCKNGGLNDSYSSSGTVAASDFSLIRDGETLF